MADIVYENVICSMWKRTRKSTQKAAPIDATVHDVRDVHHVTRGFYLLYKPENHTGSGTVHQVQ